ncbi:UDP-3-O-acyl-N-acetylglucosamine deacetylase [Synechococcales cyanobacterium C]|uniref:UDP-3-O-acyl-N-acetylglucosamine deacetylase n=1 Tax=Petrachloros mirabilis ULC683 TaxID=2781853 RepID=A0A8K1ZXR0_9CYAN|nr:UDP-3-O-acyl-N-acetylglucosamine deacetylase [Petrachloros mirabilis]NCJ07245.1 UDP-3-O-acyl-N-acetylglucosamine deacetylase [Petrachloros mirabilis ULC683]
MPDAPGAIVSTDQHTLAAIFERSGVGLHTGQQTRVRVHPAPAGRGRYFVRSDVMDLAEVSGAEIPASVDSVSQTESSTELAKGALRVRTVEHLLAALMGMGIDNARIEIDGSEVPILDGSAQGWVGAIAATGSVNQGVPRRLCQLSAPVFVQKEDAFVIALPAPALRLSYAIDFCQPIIGQQWWSGTLSDFFTQIAPARTFGFVEQIELLQARGLIKGGSLENALVCSPQAWLNPPLRFANEPVRHKILDLMGDLSLVGALPQAHVLAYKASHHLHVQLARCLTQTETRDPLKSVSLRNPSVPLTTFC